MKNFKTNTKTSSTFNVVSVPVTGQATAIVPNLRFVAKVAKYAYALEAYLAEAEAFMTGSVALPASEAQALHDFLFDMLNKLSEENEDVDSNNE